MSVMCTLRIKTYELGWILINRCKLGHNTHMHGKIMTLYVAPFTMDYIIWRKHYEFCIREVL